MLTAPSDTPTLSLTVRPWPDQVLDEVGFDPRSPYVERFWLALLGPSATLLLRRLAAELEASPAGFELDLGETARSLGLGMRGGRQSPFVRTVLRCCQFNLCHMDEGPGVLLARRRIPRLHRGQIAKLPPSLQDDHARWVADHAGPPSGEQLRQRARHLALSLFELGEGVEQTERQLLRWRFEPPVAREATAWAWHRHRRARDAADEIAG